ncbi:MAG: hypothetical protein CBARDMAM_6074 [uncultured Caballeronia sp.]|nr:MAG: hypothetical protein CBARDMAM_6074 [uncultured Caballeronia sp.]
MHITFNFASLPITTAAKLSCIDTSAQSAENSAPKISLSAVLNTGEGELFPREGKAGSVGNFSELHVAGLVESEWTQGYRASADGVADTAHNYSEAYAALVMQSETHVTSQ